MIKSEWGVGWKPLSTARFCWSVNMKSLHGDEICIKRVGSDISC